MAGIYIHIPYCKQKCHYCDFFKTSSLGSIQDFLEALQREIRVQKDYLDGEAIETIYFGGGTPSVLRPSEIGIIIRWLKDIYPVQAEVEITLEANPDDLRENYAAALPEAGVNRLSMGIQSFFDEQLELLNRRHSKAQAIEAVQLAKKSGFHNISIDLIYGIPGMSLQMWNSNIEQALELNVEHISAYHLIFEPDTVFGDRKKKGTLSEIPDDESVEQYNMLRSKLTESGYLHYEISNFARQNLVSKHNTSYWQQKKYLGLGPSAHSYSLKTRQWNERNLAGYIKLLNRNTVPYELEQLDESTMFNEYLMTSMRTEWGSSLDYVKSTFDDKFGLFLLEQLKEEQFRANFEISKSHIKIKPEKWFISDHILSQLFYVD